MAYMVNVILCRMRDARLMEKQTDRRRTERGTDGRANERTNRQIDRRF